MMNRTICSLAFILLLMSCQWKNQDIDTVSESVEAKALLQGIWIDSETEEVSFRAKGDTIYFPDSVNQPSYFRIVGDSIALGSNRYEIVKQSENTFWFVNQVGDVIKLEKSDDPIHELSFERKTPEVQTQYTEVLKSDSVVTYNGERYHWYIAINPTRYRIKSSSYNEDGVEVEQVYYDNIIHLSVYKGADCLFSSDIKKQQFTKTIPMDFLEQSVLGNLKYDYADEKGLHFLATICIPNGASCYEESVDVAI